MAEDPSYSTDEEGRARLFSDSSSSSEALADPKRVHRRDRSTDTEEQEFGRTTARKGPSLLHSTAMSEGRDRVASLRRPLYAGSSAGGSGTDHDGGDDDDDEPSTPLFSSVPAIYSTRSFDTATTADFSFSPGSPSTRKGRVHHRRRRSALALASLSLRRRERTSSRTPPERRRKSVEPLEAAAQMAQARGGKRRKSVNNFQVSRVGVGHCMFFFCLVTCFYM